MVLVVVALTLWLSSGASHPARGNPDPDGFRHALGERTLAALATGGVLRKGTVSHPEWVQCFAGSEKHGWDESTVTGQIESFLAREELFTKVDPAMKRLGWSVEGDAKSERFWTRRMTEVTGPNVLSARMTLDIDSAGGASAGDRTSGGVAKGITWRIQGQIPSSSVDDLAC